MSEAINKTMENLEAIVRRNPQIANSLLQYWQHFSELEKNPFLRWEYENYHCIVEQYIELYRRQIEYSDVGKASYQNDLDDEFFDKLEHTISATQNSGLSMTSGASYKPSDDQFYSRLHVGYSQMFNKIAEYWDKVCNDVSISCNSSVDGPKHRFIVSISNRNAIVAYSYFNQLPPDNRLVDISLPIGVQFTPHRMFPMVMHEIGHYIGLRQRMMRKTLYHELVICELLKRLYREGLYYTYETDEVPLNIYEDDNSPNDRTDERKKSLCVHLIRFLNERYDDFHEIFTQAYDMHVGQRDELLKDNRSTGNEIYSRELINLTNIALFQSLDDMRKCALKEVRRYCMEYRSQYRYISSIERLENDLSMTIDKAFEMMKIRWVNDHPDTQIARRCISYFTEIAADVFMVRTLDMTRDSYLWLMFEQWINCDERQLLDVMRSDTVMMRYPSVANLLKPTKDDDFIDDHLNEVYVCGLFEKKLNVTGHPIELNDKEKEAIKKGFELFRKQIKRLCEYQQSVKDLNVFSGYNLHLRQLEIVRAYAEYVFNDNGYTQADTDKEKPEHAVLKHIREIYRNSLENIAVASSLKRVLSYVSS